VKAGDTVRRWPVCWGRSIAMNIGSSGSSTRSSGRSAMVIPPLSQLDEKMSGRPSTSMMCWWETMFQ